MRAAMASIVMLACAGPAFASGGLSCEAKDEAARIEVESGVTRGMGGPVFNFRGSSEFVSEKVEADLGKQGYTDEHLAQYWLDGEELRLLLYRERDGDKPHGYVEITIRTKQIDDEGTYAGSYELSAFDTTGTDGGEARTFEVKGEISCFVE
ncbi:MAG: hypothetical protein KF914_20090 [Rhizobiaceae bacterium]|nr:hypothetical protein [Rhizobiaceae bacterium]